MSRFVKITSEVVAGNDELAKYLRQANIQPAQRGGAFVGSYDVAPDEFRKYGIILPKGGMIIPDAEPDKLREIINEPEKRREAEDVKRRQDVEEIYFNQVKEMLAKSKIFDIKVELMDGLKHHGIGATRWHKSFLARGEETIFNLHSEEEPYRGLDDNGSYKPWRTEYTPPEKVEAFLREERRLVESRKQFADRITRLIEMSHKVGMICVGEDNWDRPRVELLLYDNYSKSKDWAYHGSRCQNVLSAHRMMYRNKLLEICEQDIARLEQEVGERATKAVRRREMLKKLFFEHHGVFLSEARVYESSVARHSLVDGRVIDDSMTRQHFFLGEVEVTQEEYEWLKSFSSEATPPGFYRDPNDEANGIKPVIYPADKDVLVLSTGGRTPSSIVWEGEPFQLPDEVGYWAIGYLNGVCIMKGKYITEYLQKSRPLFRAWNHPNVRAARALDPSITTDVVKMWILLPALLEKEKSDKSFVKEAITLGKAYSK